MRPKDTRTGRCNCLLVQMGFAESISLETVRQTLKKRTQAVDEEGMVLPEVSGEFVARMEDVLDLYHQDYDPDHPVVCFDETSIAIGGRQETVHRGQSGTI